MNPAVEFSAVRADINQRVFDTTIRNFPDQLPDVIEEALDGLTPHQRESWMNWRALRDSRPARRQRGFVAALSLSIALLAAFSPAAFRGPQVAAVAFMITAAITMVLLLVTIGYEKELSRQPQYLTLTTRIELRRSVHRTVSLRQLRNSLAGHPVHNAEARLMIVAIEVINSIELSPAWHSSYLDEASCRYDLKGELAVLARAANYLLTQRAADRGERAAPDQVLWSALTDRVAWLHSYALHLGKLFHHGSECTNSGSFRPNPISDELRWVVTVLQETRLPHDER